MHTVPVYILHTACMYCMLHRTGFQSRDCVHYSSPMLPEHCMYVLYVLRTGTAVPTPLRPPTQYYTRSDDYWGDYDYDYVCMSITIYIIIRINWPGPSARCIKPRTNGHGRKYTPHPDWMQYLQRQRITTYIHEFQNMYLPTYTCLREWVDGWVDGWMGSTYMYIRGGYMYILCVCTEYGVRFSVWLFLLGVVGCKGGRLWDTRRKAILRSPVLRSPVKAYISRKTIRPEYTEYIYIYILG